MAREGKQKGWLVSGRKEYVGKEMMMEVCDRKQKGKELEDVSKRGTIYLKASRK